MEWYTNGSVKNLKQDSKLHSCSTHYVTQKELLRCCVGDIEMDNM